MIIYSPYDDVELVPVPLTTYVLDGAGGRAAGRPSSTGPPAG